MGRTEVSRGSSSTSEALAAYRAGVPQRGDTADAVTNALREAILDGALQSNTWLREDELAREFSVSRTPVREALRRLADEGLALKTANHGTVVASLSLDDVLALYVVRGQLEALAARLAAQRSPTGLVQGLQAIQRHMRQAGPTAPPSDLAKHNLEFHRELRTATGNIYLERFLLQVEHAVRRLPGSTFHIDGRLEQVLNEHQAIIDAISLQDPEEAAQSAQRHMSMARDLRIRMLLGEY